MLIPQALVQISQGGSYSDYSVAFTGSVSNPNQGVGTTIARFIQIGELVHLVVRLNFLDPGTNAGSGTYSASLPVVPAVAVYGGSVMLFDSSAGSFRIGVCEIDPGNNRLNLIADSATARVSNTVPWTWATGDFISLDLTYEAA